MQWPHNTPLVVRRRPYRRLTTMPILMSYAARPDGSASVSHSATAPARRASVPARPLINPLVRPHRSWPFLSSAFYAANKPKAPPPELETDSEDGLALPVEPDEGTVLIPDDERVINVPS